MAGSTLVVVNYVDYDPTWPCTYAVECRTTVPEHFPGRMAKLFRNLGPDKNGRVRFEDGRGRRPGEAARSGLGVCCGRF